MRKLFLIALLAGCASTSPEPYSEAELEPFVTCFLDNLMEPSDVLVTTLVDMCLAQGPNGAREIYAREQERYRRR